MEIGFDQFERQAAHAPRAFVDGFGDAPEWLVLRARLSAAWSARREFAAGAWGAPVRCGHFDHDSAVALAGYEHPTPLVNPIALGNLKPSGGNAGRHAG